MKSNTVTTSENLLLSNLLKTIEKKHFDILRVTNSRLIMLFWQIGEDFNKYDHELKDRSRNQSLTSDVSADLQKKYGSYFSQSNLKKMVQFNGQFAAFPSIPQYIGSLLTWEHISLLLKLTHFEAKLFYINLTIEKELSVAALRKAIAANMFDTSVEGAKASRINVNNSPKSNARLYAGRLLQIFHLGIEKLNDDNGVIKNLFKKPGLSSFRPLIEPSKEKANQMKRHNILIFKDELYNILLEQIENYRSQQNAWLNSYLNSSFTEIGKQINETQCSESKLYEISTFLQKKYDPDLNGKQLKDMSALANQLTDPDITLKIVSLVSWEHLGVLLSVQELEAKLFYAELTAAEDLSVNALKKHIAEKGYETWKNANENIQVPVKHLALVTKRVKNITITTKFIDVNFANRRQTNFFKSPYTMFLM